MASEVEFVSWLEGFADRNGVPRAPCAAIAKAIGENAALRSEMMSLQSIADYYDKGSSALRAVVDPCVPPREKLGI
jgi:hypothetical protein